MVRGIKDKNKIVIFDSISTLIDHCGEDSLGELLKWKELFKKYDTTGVFLFIEWPYDTKVLNKIRLMADAIVQLKAMAIELEITIFLAVHVKKVFGRAVEMQDLKECAALYQKPDYVICIGREMDIQMVGGRKTEIYSGNSNLRFLKNRLNGTKPFLNIVFIDNVIVPAAEEGGGGAEIEVVDDKDGNYFGYNN